MTMEAMKQALEALSYVMSHGVAVQQAKDILLEAIEQAEKQEPVAWTPKIDRMYDANGMLISQKIKRTPSSEWEDYYPAPQREWQGLTDEERSYLAWESNNGSHCVAMTEAKLKEKNA